MANAQANRSTVSSKLILPFVKSVRETLAAMAGWETVIEKPRLKTEHGPEYDYSGIISLAGSYVGTVVVSFHRDLAIKLVTAMVHADIPPETPDFCDAIGELANMIAGAAKNDFGGPTTTISIPSVVMGKGHVIARPSDVPCIVVPCGTVCGKFAVEVSIKAS